MAAYQCVYVMKGLNKTFPGGKQVLKDIWLSILPGAEIGVLGQNGSGKSTPLKICASASGPARSTEDSSHRRRTSRTTPTEKPQPIVRCRKRPTT